MPPSDDFVVSRCRKIESKSGEICKSSFEFIWILKIFTDFHLHYVCFQLLL